MWKTTKCGCVDEGISEGAGLQPETTKTPLPTAQVNGRRLVVRPKGRNSAAAPAGGQQLPGPPPIGGGGGGGGAAWGADAAPPPRHEFDETRPPGLEDPSAAPLYCPPPPGGATTYEQHYYRALTHYQSGTGLPYDHFRGSVLGGRGEAAESDGSDEGQGIQAAEISWVTPQPGECVGKCGVCGWYPKAFTTAGCNVLFVCSRPPSERASINSAPVCVSVQRTSRQAPRATRSGTWRPRLRLKLLWRRRRPQRQLPGRPTIRACMGHMTPPSTGEQRVSVVAAEGVGCC